MGARFAGAHQLLLRSPAMSVRRPASAVWIQMSPNRRRLRHRNGDTRHRGQSLQPIRNTNVVGAVWRCWRVSGGLMGWRGMSERWVLLPTGCGMPMTPSA